MPEVDGTDDSAALAASLSKSVLTASGLVSAGAMQAIESFHRQFEFTAATKMAEMAWAATESVRSAADIVAASTSNLVQMASRANAQSETMARMVLQLAKQYEMAVSDVVLPASALQRIVDESFRSNVLKLASAARTREAIESYMVASINAVRVDFEAEHGAVNDENAPVLAGLLLFGVIIAIARYSKLGGWTVDQTEQIIKSLWLMWAISWTLAQHSPEGAAAVGVGTAGIKVATGRAIRVHRARRTAD